MCRRASNNSVGLCHTPLPSSERIVPAPFSALCYCRRLYMYAGDWVGMPVGCRAIVFSSFALLSTSHVDIRSNASQLWKAIEKRTKRKSWLTSRWQIVNQLKRHLYSTANLTQISIDWSINSLIALFLYCPVMCLLVCLVTLAASSGKRNVAVWRPSASPSVCLSREHTHRDSPGGSMRRGQRTFRLENKQHQHTCLQSVYSYKAPVTSLLQKFSQKIVFQKFGNCMKFMEH